MSGPDDAALSDDRLFDALLEGARRDVAAIRARLAGETIYAIGLYTSGESAYAVACVCTEEGLAQVVERYAAEQPRTSREVHALELRDSIADSPHHAWSTELPGLRPASALLAARSEHVFRLFQEASARGEDAPALGAAWDRRTEEVMLRVLEALDREGAFGETRERMIVNLYRGDQDEAERVRYAKRLNPLAAFATYAAHYAKLGTTI